MILFLPYGKWERGFEMPQTIIGKSFDEERALYGANGISVYGCRFDGPADGESAFKEGRNLQGEVT